MNLLAIDAALVGLPRHPCPHRPICPDFDQSDHDMARVVNRHDEVGVSVLCNGVWIYDDTGERLPDGTLIAPHRPGVPHRVGTP
jgi:hypothetical protein